MAKAGKIIALIAGILTLIGTFGFSLLTMSPIVNYGIGGSIALFNIFKAGVSGWTVVDWIFVIGYIIFLLSFILQLIGIKSRIAAFFGSLLPLAVVTIIFLGFFNVWDGWLYILAFSSEPLVTQWIPMTFGFGLEYSLLPGLIIDLGTFIVGAGGLLSLVSVFLTRED
jgi:hypothetical protein